MDILMLGGTRFFGVHAVNEMLSRGHSVTVATRGRTPDAFGNRVERLTVERASGESLSDALKDKAFDVCVDNLAYCSNDVRALLDCLDAERYVVTSSVSAYMEIRENMSEAELDTTAHPLEWRDYRADKYDEMKRQVECAAFQAYPGRQAAAVRFPFVVGEDDYTNRLFFYAEHVAKGLPMYVDNLDSKVSLIHSRDAGRFLAWLAEQKLTGPVNACSNGTVTLSGIIGYLEDRTGMKAVLSADAEPAPYNGAPDFSMDTSKAQDAGYVFADTKEWIFPLLEAYLEKIRTEK